MGSSEIGDSADPCLYVYQVHPLGYVYSIVIYPHRECTSSPGMVMYLTRNAHPHRELECDSEPEGAHMFIQGVNVLLIHVGSDKIPSL